MTKYRTIHFHFPSTLKQTRVIFLQASQTSTIESATNPSANRPQKNVAFRQGHCTERVHSPKFDDFTKGRGVWRIAEFPISLITHPVNTGDGSDPGDEAEFCKQRSNVSNVSMRFK